ncbi:methyltransferase type 12 [Purpureocillium lavendulum]|uniref:Methyltransferase type 12 n=1 Tax=Purpureocillium lavendulum TaxID=1247861 RepID=A0AB34FZY6_9HYPO|nr:methyltransferase type 12 [Purpureocillium lavendulum]
MEHRSQNDSGALGAAIHSLKSDTVEPLYETPVHAAPFCATLANSSLTTPSQNTDTNGQSSQPVLPPAPEIPDGHRIGNIGVAPPDIPQHPQDQQQPQQQPLAAPRVGHVPQDDGAGDKPPHEANGSHAPPYPETSELGRRPELQLPHEPVPLPLAGPESAKEPQEYAHYGIRPCVPESSTAVQQDAAQEALFHSKASSPAPVEGQRRPESLLLSPLTHPNGQSIFPTLSTSEQEEMAREALSQAEASIVAESLDSASIVDDGTDGGYDSDGFSSGSTSAESSVRDYMFENGRRYHRFREGTYNFPNDDVEQEREDMKHAMVKLLCSQKLHFAPIGDYPQEVLDIGTGTGIWAIEMGDQFPSAHVLGIDLSPIQPDWLPPNVRFLVDDVESPWLHPRNHFDYIHSRHTVMAVKDWTRMFRRAYEHLKPGGWIELQEVHHCPKTAKPGGAVDPQHGVVQFWARVTEGLNSLGVNLDMAAGGLLASMMREVGFVNVTERIFHVPIGTWPKNKVLKTVGLYWRTILLDGIQAIALGPLTRGLHWDREHVELFLMDVRRAYQDNSALMYMPLHIVYAQKPEYAM